MAATPSQAAIDGADAPTFPADAIEIGYIVGAWGIKGAFKVVPHAADPQALYSSRRWYLRAPVGSRRSVPGLLRLTEVREQAALIVASAQEVPDRDAAEALTGAIVFVSRASFPTAGEGEYYWVDLIGLGVINREGLVLGRVVGLIDTGVHSVLRVTQPELAADSAERLIPFVAAYIDGVDVAARVITVDWQPDY